MLETISTFFETFVVSIYNFFNLSFDIISSGFTFLLSFFANIPSFIYNSFISVMPDFFQVGFYGLLGIMILILFLKIFSLIKL